MEVNGEDASYFDLLPKEIQEMVLEHYWQDRAWREHREK